MKVREKLVKVNESFTVNRYDNGYVIEVSGRTKNEDYKSAKIIARDEDELVELVKEVLSMEVDD